MALNSGDIAFVSFNADEDGWSIVTFVDIDPNTIANSRMKCNGF